MPRDLKILNAPENFLRGSNYPINYALVITYSLFSYCIESEYESLTEATEDIDHFVQAIKECKHWRKSGFFEVFPADCQSYSALENNGNSVIPSEKSHELSQNPIYLGYIVVDQSNACYPLVCYAIERMDTNEKQIRPKECRAKQFADALENISKKLSKLDECYKLIREATNTEYKKMRGLLKPDCFFNEWIKRSGTKDCAIQDRIKERLK